MEHEADLKNLPHTHVMFHHVETACAADVKKFCEATPAPVALPATTGDPFLDWLFIPMAPPPPDIRDLTRMMDRIFDPVFIQPSRDYVTLFWVEEPQHAPQFLIDSVAAKAAEQRQAEEIPQLVHDLQKYGNDLLSMHDQDSFEHSMARRLTEIDATTIQHHLHLPFGSAKNLCLRKAFADGSLSPECKSSIQEMESTFVLESQLGHRQGLFLGMMWVYIGTLCILLFQLARKMQSQRAKRQLRMRILQAVYSNPEIKRQVEDDLGQSVGFVPPISVHALTLLGPGKKDLKEALRCIRRVHMIVFALLLTLIIVAPFWVLPICIVISVLRVVELCFIPNNSGDGECECCCCGATTIDAENGTLTEEQQCCNCCKGTGVCTPTCADCCGPKSRCSDSCGLVTESCCMNKDKDVNECNCCCCGATSSQFRDGTLTADQVCCNCCKGTGVCTPTCADCCGTGGCCCKSTTAGNTKENTKTLVEECTCCCCGSTPSMARDGNLTTDQVCCNCCKGTGVCSASCASCCGNGCCCGGGEEQQACHMKGRGQKHVVSVRNKVYCGVPLQVV